MLSLKIGLTCLVLLVFCIEFSKVADNSAPEWLKMIVVIAFFVALVGALGSLIMAIWTLIP